MKKTVVLFVLICSALLSFAQTKVAVYVTATDSVPIETLKVIGGEMVSAFVSTTEYSAIERTSEFLAEISKEQEYQRGGSVDDRQICELGKQFGVDLVCITDITLFKTKFYIHARLIDVEKAVVLATAREISTLNALDTVIQVAEKLAKSLISSEVTYTLVVENTTSSARDIYIENELIGNVPKGATRNFDVRLGLVGTITAVPTGVFGGKKMQSTIQKMKARDTVTIKF